METKVATTRDLKAYEFACPKCGKVERKSAYCIAQQSMGHQMRFSCTCGKSFIVPKSE